MSSQRMVRGFGWSAIWVLTLVIMVFLVIRIGDDLEAFSTGAIPPEGSSTAGTH